MHCINTQSVVACSCDSEGLLAALPLDVTLFDGTGADCPVTVKEAYGGQLRCTYTARSAGFYRLEVTCRGAHLPSSPFSVQVSSPLFFMLRVLGQILRDTECKPGKQAGQPKTCACISSIGYDEQPVAD